KFEILNYLTQHFASVTGEIIDIERLSFGVRGTKLKIIKPLTCSVCDYTTTSLFQIRYHLICHLNGNKFSCSECKYTHIRKDHLYAHMKEHVVIYVYYCNKCDYTSSNKTDFQTHKSGHELGESKSDMNSSNEEDKLFALNAPETFDVEKSMHQ
ncbi:unnamed protein product, partial [Meganyctiphanes norvegica]